MSPFGVAVFILRCPLFTGEVVLQYWFCHWKKHTRFSLWWIESKAFYASRCKSLHRGCINVAHWGMNLEEISLTAATVLKRNWVNVVELGPFESNSICPAEFEDGADGHEEESPWCQKVGPGDRVEFRYVVIGWCMVYIGRLMDRWMYYLSMDTMAILRWVLHDHRGSFPCGLHGVEAQSDEKWRE